MSKTEESLRTWGNVPFSTWNYEIQTETKHNLLKKYLPVWFQILGKYNKTLNYIDGFGGIGAYHNEDDVKSGNYNSNNFGSPIIAIKSITDLLGENSSSDVKVIIIDSNSDNLSNVDIILNNQELGFKPSYIHGDFDNEINKILDEIEESGKSLAPTFFFVDPFGFKIKHATIVRLMSTPKSEVLINFMYTRINEFLGSPALETTLNELFGNDDWKSCLDKKGAERELEIVRSYRNQFKKYGYFVVPYKFEFPNQKRTYYYLFHISQHWTGCSVLKDISSKLASEYGGHMEFQARTRTLDLFSFLPNHKRVDSCNKFFCYEKGSSGCDDCIYKRFKGSSLSYLDFRNNIIDELPLTESGIKNALRELEGKKLLTINSGKSRKRERGFQRGFREDDILNFKS